MSSNNGDLPKDDHPMKPRSALASPKISGQSPRASSMKSVSIHEPESISPLMRGKHREIDADHESPFQIDRPSRHPIRASIGPKVTSRPSTEIPKKARTPAELLNLKSVVAKNASGPQSAEPSTIIPSGLQNEVERPPSTSSRRHGHRLTYHDLVKWLQKEKARRSTHKSRKRHDKHSKKHRESEKLGISAYEAAEAHLDGGNVAGESSHARRDSSASSEGSLALDMLREILEHQMTLRERPSGNALRSNASTRSLRMLRRASTAASSDTDFFDGEILVPTCEVLLDNSQTLSYTGGAATEGKSKPILHRSISTRERDAWTKFKLEIIKITHTLKLHGWRRVPLNEPDRITVDRLSGALTNAVYVVSPPEELAYSRDDGKHQKAKPKKLLLRIYGSQVDHLIDRESELQILRRLSKKHIGPRLLGTFINGRFEEYLNAKALTAEELQRSDISRQIAKRMRELHDGVQLLETEIDAGPFVLQNIDKWMSRAEHIVNYLEAGVKDGNPLLQKLSVTERFVGADFASFKTAVLKHRQWIEKQYQNHETNLRERLVFAHNDAQYGNILRLVTEGESPLLLPINEHKRLVVIDFEYANANTPGLEFANHFTEWCYNYHDEAKPYVCNVERYPKTTDQANFLTAYVMHRPAFAPAPGTISHRSSTYYESPSYPSTPAMLPVSAIDMMSSLVLENRPPPSPGQPKHDLSSSVAAARVPPASTHSNVSDEENDYVRRRVEYLMWETKIWRGINSAQWVLWGIVQAKIPGMPDLDVDRTPRADEGMEMKVAVKTETKASEKDEAEDEEEEEEEDGFDYLSYARERAAFFWGDVISQNIMSEDELSKETVQEARVLDY